MNIRLTQETDLDSILKVIESAFSDEENKVIMNLVQELSREVTSPSIKSLVAEIDNQVIGYVSFSPIFLKSDVIFQSINAIETPLFIQRKRHIS